MIQNANQLFISLMKNTDSQQFTRLDRDGKKKEDRTGENIPVSL